MCLPHHSNPGKEQGCELPFLPVVSCKPLTISLMLKKQKADNEVNLTCLGEHLFYFVYFYQSAGAPGMPLPGAGTSTAFLSSVSPTHCSTSRASRSMSSSDFSGFIK